MDTSSTVSPAIYIVASDGTRFAVPEQAAALSSLLRGALDVWTREHAPPPPPDDDDDHDDATTASSGTSDSDATAEMLGGETTPDRLDDDDAATYNSSQYAHSTGAAEERGLPGSMPIGAGNAMLRKTPSPTPSPMAGRGTAASADDDDDDGNEADSEAPFTGVRRMVSVDAANTEDMEKASSSSDDEPAAGATPSAKDPTGGSPGPGTPSDRTASVIDEDSRAPSGASAAAANSPQKPLSNGIAAAAHAEVAELTANLLAEQKSQQLRGPSSPGASPNNGSQPCTPAIIDRDTATPSTLDEEDDEGQNGAAARGLDDDESASSSTERGSGSGSVADTKTPLRLAVGKAASPLRLSAGALSVAASSAPVTAPAPPVPRPSLGSDDDDATPEDLSPAATSPSEDAGAAAPAEGRPPAAGDGTAEKLTPTHADPSVTTTATAASTAAAAAGTRKPSTPLRQSAGPIATVIVADTENDDDDRLLETALARAAGENGTASGSGAGPLPTMDGAVEWVSPTSVHQRTPVMLGDDDEVVIVRGDGQEETIRSFARQSSPSSAATTTTTAAAAPPVSTAGGSGSARASSATAGTVTPPAAAVKGLASAGAANSSFGGDAASVVPLSAAERHELRGARITATEILIDLRAAAAAGTPSGAATLSRSSSVSSTSSPALASTGPSKEKDATGGASRGKTNGHAPASGAGATSGTLRATAATTHLCVNYLLHFAHAELGSGTLEAAGRAAFGGSSNSSTNGNPAARPAGALSSPTAATAPGAEPGSASALDMLFGAAGSSGNGVSGSPTVTAATAAAADESGQPAVLPSPLPAPLVSLLSPWEQHFLYVTILRYDEASILPQLRAVMTACPALNYATPGSALNDDKARKTLLVPAPPPDGMVALRQVMQAAKELRVQSLYDLCCAWMGDHMLRICYGATDNFEAAHLIRQSFHVQSDWTRKETDCLKLENEWPANEEES